MFIWHANVLGITFIFASYFIIHTFSFFSFYDYLFIISFSFPSSILTLFAVGPENTPYWRGLFHIELRFPTTYPSNSPSATVLTPLPHPHVHANGKICLDMLSDFQVCLLSIFTSSLPLTSTLLLWLNFYGGLFPIYGRWHES